MGVKERILTIRLMEKAKAMPAAAEAIGILVITDFREENSSSESVKD